MQSHEVHPILSKIIKQMKMNMKMHIFIDKIHVLQYYEWYFKVKIFYILLSHNLCQMLPLLNQWFCSFQIDRMCYINCIYTNLIYYVSLFNIKLTFSINLWRIIYTGEWYTLLTTLSLVETIKHLQNIEPNTW